MINYLKMKRAAQCLNKIFNEVESFIEPGISTMDIDYLIRGCLVVEGCKSATVGYNPPGATTPYPAACCTSVNSVLAHGVPSTTTILTEGDIISVDIALSFDGHFADACRTYTVGNVSEEVADLAGASSDLTYNIIQFISNNRDLITTEDIGAYCTFWATELGYWAVPVLGGHGIGLTMHSDPFIPSAPGRSNIPIKLPSYFTVEPIICTAPTEIELGIDGWTLSSSTGVLSAQTEHVVFLTDRGAEILV